MLRWIGIALALFGPPWAESPAQVGSNTDTCQQAVQLHQASDFPGAIAAYRECLNSNPTRYDLRSNFGAALAASGKYAEAIEQYQKALAGAPPQFISRLRRNLGLAFYKSGRYGDAIEALLQVRKEQGPDLTNDLLLADCYLRNGQPKEAAELLSIYKAQAKTDKAVAYVLGTALIRSGQVDEGQKVIDLILRDGDSAESRFLMGTSLFASKDFPQAVKEFAGALALNPDLPGLHSWYGQALLNTGDADAAANAFREELARDPNDFESNLLLGEILLNRKAAGEAEAFLEKAASARSHSYEAQMGLARAELLKQEYARATSLLRGIVAEWQSAAGAHEKLAEAYAASGLSEEAELEKKAAAKLHAAANEGENSGPKVGELAPDFILPALKSEKRVSLAELRLGAQLGSGGKPVVLVFGSYTCPNFRKQASAINALADKFAGDSAFLLVYIREAHTGGTWQSTINEREGIDWAPAKTLPEMRTHASACVRKLKMNFPAVVDGMDGKVEFEYAAWPSRLYVIGKTGRVVYRTWLTELDFHPEEIEAAIGGSINR